VAAIATQLIGQDLEAVSLRKHGVTMPVSILAIRKQGEDRPRVFALRIDRGQVAKRPEQVLVAEAIPHEQQGVRAEQQLQVLLECGRRAVALGQVCILVVSLARDDGLGIVVASVAMEHAVAILAQMRERKLCEGIEVFAALVERCARRPLDLAIFQEGPERDPSVRLESALDLAVEIRREVPGDGELDEGVVHIAFSSKLDAPRTEAPPDQPVIAVELTAVPKDLDRGPDVVHEEVGDLVLFLRTELAPEALQGFDKPRGM
jgi:hypothetical protein